MEPIKVLYDATHIGECACFRQNGSGIYSVTYNILRELLKRPEFKVQLYCAPCAVYGLRTAIKRDDALKECTIRDDNSTVLDDAITFMHSCRENAGNSKAGFFWTVCIKITIKVIKIMNVFLQRLNRLFHRENNQQRYSDVDIFFSPVYVIPDEIKHIDRIRKYTILYDLIPLLLDEYKGDISGWIGPLLKSINSEDNYFTISQCTKDDFVEHLPEIDPDKTTVALLAAAKHFHPCSDPAVINAVKEKYKIPLGKKYFLNLSFMDSRKNLLFSLKCFAEFIRKNKIDDLVFVLGGGSGEKFIAKNSSILKEIGITSDQVVATGYVADEDLAALYSGAECFVFVSLYEGFGLPVLEAMQCGCPVITSNVSSLPEVVGDVGIMVTPTEKDELIDAYKKLYDNPQFCKALSAKGIERAKLFSWSNCVDIIAKEMLK